MRDIMTRMINRYDEEISTLEAELKMKKISNPAHEVFRTLMWCKAKRQAVTEVLAEYDKEIRQNK